MTAPEFDLPVEMGLSLSRTWQSRARLLVSLPAKLGICLLVIGMTAPAAWGQTPQVPLPVPAPTSPKATDLALPKAAPKVPAPDVWSESEVTDAKRICQQVLKSMSAVVVPLPPVKKGRCGAPAPVRLISIGKKNPVEFVPPPTLACGMLVPLKRWIDKGLQPHAARHLDTRVSRVSIMSSYSCRTRYGRKGARMSEHAFANALDIGGFRLADGGRVSVLKDWGMTKRDIAKALLAEQKNAADAPLATADARATKPASPIAVRPSRQAAANRPRPPLPPVRIQRRRRAGNMKQPGRTAFPQLRRPERAIALPPRDQPRAQLQSSERRSLVPRVDPRPVALDRATAVVIPPLPTRRPLRRAVRRRASLDSATRPASLEGLRSQEPPRARPLTKPPYRLGGPKPSGTTPRAEFLRSVHQAACRIFGTTLGPEANEAHRNHFHFDMFPRRNRGYCE